MNTERERCQYYVAPQPKKLTKRHRSAWNLNWQILRLVTAHLHIWAKPFQWYRPNSAGANLEYLPWFQWCYCTFTSWPLIGKWLLKSASVGVFTPSSLSKSKFLIWTKFSIACARANSLVCIMFGWMWKICKDKGKTKSSVWKLKIDTFKLEIRCTFLMVRVINYWNNLPRDAVDWSL